MALPIVIAVAAAPGLLGTQEAIRQSQAKEKREEHRARRCNLVASCVKSSSRSREIHGRPVVLRNGKLYIDTGISDGKAFGHPYAGYYLPYPDEKFEGLVTTTSDEAPIMNWIYVDKETFEVKYGVRADAQPNLTGPFDCTRQDRRLTFDGWEGWCAVEEYPTIWALYFDKDDTGLRSKISRGTKILELELLRKEKRWKKEIEARKDDQTTKRAVNTEEEIPKEESLGDEAIAKQTDTETLAPERCMSQFEDSNHVEPRAATAKEREAVRTTLSDPAESSGPALETNFNTTEVIDKQPNTISTQPVTSNELAKINKVNDQLPSTVVSKGSPSFNAFRTQPVMYHSDARSSLAAKKTQAPNLGESPSGTDAPAKVAPLSKPLFVPEDPTQYLYKELDKIFRSECDEAPSRPSSESSTKSSYINGSSTKAMAANTAKKTTTTSSPIRRMFSKAKRKTSAN